MCPCLVDIRLACFTSRDNLRTALCSGDDMMASCMSDQSTKYTFVNGSQLISNSTESSPIEII